jgi:hypothetical protein
VSAPASVTIREPGTIPVTLDVESVTLNVEPALPIGVTMRESEQIPVTATPVGPAAITVVQGGARGPVGPQGPSGTAGASLVFAFTQSSEWICEHNLGRLPASITVYDSAGNVRPFVPISNPNLDTTILNPNPPLAGSVVIL